MSYAFPEVVGISEAAEILGVSKQRASQLSDKPDFPKPVATLRATPIWLRSDVERYHSTRSLRPGPVANEGTLTG